MNQFTYIATTRIWQLTVVNFTALALTCLGGVIFGAAPAMAATLHAVHRLERLTAGELCCEMWGTYRCEFVRANTVGLPWVAIAATLIWFGPGLGIYGFALAITVALSALCFTAGSLLITAHIDASIRDTVHNAWMAILLSPYGHLLVLLTLGPWLWVIWQQPLVGLYMGLSLPAFVYSGVVLPSVSAGFPAKQSPISQQEALT